MELLNLQGLSHIVGIPPSTAAAWIKEFNMYVPKVQDEEESYYLPEAIDVLKFIKVCKSKHYKQHDISERLANGHFPIIVECSKKDTHKEEVDQEYYKENIRTIMQTLGLTVANIAKLEQSFQVLKQKQSEQVQEINKLKKQIEWLQRNQKNDEIN
ncbi:MerR family transcriptional regulator [Virgibacillus proomii]|uniref:MerR family transcriptional regulator n=1 Tax=Virgibacillus proomii TaxID=84407 RepID=UPI001C0F62AE|nr:MerR family transcriptional regulator [Virgibacillus proomii]MBU5266936.1 MerR family transcriptional regulator [Virgibacillus proomii]